LRETLTVIFTKDELPYFKDENGNFWAVCLFIEDTITYSAATTPELAYQGGVGIGKFQTLLSDFTTPLAETIKGFHNIRWRFKQWDESLARDAANRKKDLAKEISWIESRREEMLNFWSLVENGTIPTRVTHNDTKISNILFDKSSGNVLCAIDLDTVMSSTSLNDFGDAIRSYTNTGLEDDRDLSKVSMSLEMFKAYALGYLSERKESLVQSEIDHLAFSAKYITYEQVLRFLMDYIDGDTYYKVNAPDHNLVRTWAQYKLLQSIEEQYEQMCEIIRTAVK
jgi:Phosphotransferase enzyme family.